VLSSAAIVGNTVYTSAGTLAGESAVGDLLALDTETGQERWRARLPSFSNASPAVIDGAVYIGDLSGMMSCFDAASGTLRWQTLAGTYISLSSPGVVDGRVYVMAAGVVVALDAADGDLSWQLTIGPGSDDVDASPVVTGGLVIIGGGDGNLYALGDPAS
jgi:outer membrane protein assembly factor BamB